MESILQLRYKYKNKNLYEQLYTFIDHKKKKKCFNQSYEYQQRKKKVGLVIYKIKKEGTIRYGYEVGVTIEKRWKGSVMWWGDPLPKID